MLSKIKRFALCLTVLVLCAGAQVTPKTVVQYYTGGGLLQYVCEAPPVVATTTLSVAAGTLTNATVATNEATVTTVAAHGLYTGAYVTLSGSTTDALNGSYTIASVPTTTSFTLTTSGVSDGIYSSGLIMSTSAPLLTNGVWSVTVLRYNASDKLDRVTLGGGSISANYKAKCSERANY